MILNNGGEPGQQFYINRNGSQIITLNYRVTRGVGRGRALGAGAPPFSAKTTLRAPPSLMSLQPGNYWYRLVADKQHVQELAILY